MPQYSFIVNLSPENYDKARRRLEALGFPMNAACQELFTRTCREGVLAVRQLTRKALNDPKCFVQPADKCSVSFQVDDVILNMAVSLLSPDGITPEKAIQKMLLAVLYDAKVPFVRAPRRRIKPQDTSALQGDLFAPVEATASAPATPPVTLPPIRVPVPVTEEKPEAADPQLVPTTLTETALLDGEAKLEWRLRERLATLPEPDNPLFHAPGTPKQLVETPQFYKEKVQIKHHPLRQLLIAAIEALFTDITVSRVPARTHHVAEHPNARFTALGHYRGGEFGNLGVLYEMNDDDICLVRFGELDELFETPRH